MTNREKLINLLIQWTDTNNGIHADALVDFLVENNVFALPCKIGTDVYCIATPCGGCEEYESDVLTTCFGCAKREIIQCRFDYDLIPEFGKTVFLTNKEAEKALKEREK